MLRYDEKRSEYFKYVINSIFTSFLNVKSKRRKKKLMKIERFYELNEVFSEEWGKMLLNFMNKLTSSFFSVVKRKISNKRKKKENIFE